MARTQILPSWHLSAWLNQPYKTVILEKTYWQVAMGYGIKNVWIHFTTKELVHKTMETIETYIYYHFVGHCGAFCGLKCRILREKCILAGWNKPIKSENPMIVRSKQLIKIEKPFQSLLTFSHSAGEEKYSSKCFVVIFSVFISSMPQCLNASIPPKW